MRRVPAPDHVVQYAVKLARATRTDAGASSAAGSAPGAANAMGAADRAKRIAWGAGPRASQYLVLGAKARAVLQGRFAASIDDVKDVAVPVLSHRVVVTFQAQSAGVKAADVVADIVKQVPA